MNLITMVNPGHASVGCITCKLRKVQCDLERPLCRRCTESGRMCLGFGDREVDPQASLFGDDDYSQQIKSSVRAVTVLEILFVSEGPHDKPLHIAAMQDYDWVAVDVMVAIRKCLHSVRQPLQSQVERKSLLSEYATATSNLRATLHAFPHSPAVGCAVYLFSLYEVRLSCQQPKRFFILIRELDDCQH